MEYGVLTAERVLSKEEADAYLGETVPEIEPNITEACVIADAETNEPVFAYLPLERDTISRLRRAVLRVKYGKTVRTGTGMTNVSRTFGMSPRKPLAQRDSCRPYTLAQEDPDAHTTIVTTAYALADQLKSIFPQVYERDEATITEVADSWRMAKDALWTSGVINKTSTLPYHRDGFNFDTWSAMPVLRRNVTGGYLHIPEYNLTCAARDGYALYFCGYRLVHGVTPMTQTAKSGYRYSVVYYALRGMKDCFTYAVETARAQDKRTEREENMASALRGERPFITEENLKSLGKMKGVVRNES